MRWANIKPDISHINLSEIASRWSAIDVVTLLDYTKEYPLVLISEFVRNKIVNHLKTRNVELGGLLIGSVVSSFDLDSGIVLVIVNESIECHDFDSTSVSLSMNSSVWQSASKVTTNDNFVVGWYHSHPNLGAFFSGVDRRTQKNFFSSAYNIGLVIDPIKNDEKWFWGADSIELNSHFVMCGLNGLALA